MEGTKIIVILSWCSNLIQHCVGYEYVLLMGRRDYRNIDYPKRGWQIIDSCQSNSHHLVALMSECMGEWLQASLKQHPIFNSLLSG